MPGPIQTSPPIPQLPSSEAWKVATADMHSAASAISTPTVPLVATGAASSSALHAIRVLQSADFPAGDWRTDAPASQAVDLLATATGALSTAPTPEAIASARDLILQAAELAPA